jgi:hypothetical protein
LTAAPRSRGLLGSCWKNKTVSEHDAWLLVMRCAELRDRLAEGLDRVLDLSLYGRYVARFGADRLQREQRRAVSFERGRDVIDS